MNDMTTVTTAMTRAYAENLVTIVKRGISDARHALFELRDGEGWRALGYDSWRQCVISEFSDISSNYLYRQVYAAMAENAAGIEIGSLPESSLRPVYTILNDKGLQREAILSAIGSGGGTAEVFEAAAMATYVNNRGGRLARRLAAGDISPRTAFSLSKLADSASDLSGIVESVSDPNLASMIISSGEEVIREIVITGCVPARGGKQVPLENATVQDLSSYYSELRSASWRERVETREEMIDRLVATILATVGLPDEIVQLAAAVKSL